MIVLCDASPLIFLAKLNRLALISSHNFRISITLYQSFLAEFQSH